MDTANHTARSRSASKRSWKGNVKRRVNQDGSIAWVAMVRVRPFHARSQTFRSKDDAAAWADAEKTKLIAERRKAGDARPDLTSLTVSQLAAAYLADPEAQRLLSYKDSCARLAWWVNKIGEKRIREVGVVTLRDARDKLAQTGIAPATINRYLSALRSAWNWGRASGYLAENQVWPPRLLLTERRPRTRHLTELELPRVLAAAKDQGPTMYAAVLVSIATGLRKGELLRLKWADVDFEAQSLRILISKNGDARGAHLPSSAAAALRDLKRANVVSTSAVFINERGEPATQWWVERFWRRIRAAAGLQGFRWHDLRHSCASLLAANGASLLEIGSVLGHRSPAVTARYAHLVDTKAVTGHAALDKALGGK